MDENSEANVGQAPVPSELDNAKARLTEMHEQASLGGYTAADRNLIKAQETKIAGLSETVATPTIPTSVEAPIQAAQAVQKEGIGRRVLSVFKNFRTRGLKPQTS